MTERYAIYYLPDPESEIGRFGSALLGRCLRGGQTLARPVWPGVSQAELLRHTGQAALYGFHGTIVAPFETDSPESDLLALAASMAESSRAVKLGRLKLRGGSFAALWPETTPESLSLLERRWVTAFSRFRRPLTESDLSRRGPLEPRLKANLLQWGYHLVFDDFKFHLTVADSLPAEPEGFLAALASGLAPALAQPLTVDRLALCRQPSRTEPFVCLKTFWLPDSDNETGC